jgi:hypothetical protein
MTDMPATSQEAALEFAGRLTQIVNHARVGQEQGEPLTMRAGAATVVPRNTPSIDHLCDNALQHLENGG